MRDTLNNILDDTLKDLMRVKPKIAEMAISRILAQQIQLFGEQDTGELNLYLRSHGLPPVNGSDANVAGRVRRAG